MTNLKPITAEEFYLKRMDVDNAHDIAEKIVGWIRDGIEDDYYAVKYGRRMIEALIAREKP